MFEVKEKNGFPKKLPLEIEGGDKLTEPLIKSLAHLPFLTLVHMSIQRKLTSAPVTALELAAFLEIELIVAEDILKYLEINNFVCSFNEEIPAYYMIRDLQHITLKDLLGLLAEYQRSFDHHKLAIPAGNTLNSNQKYRKIYSELASEMLALFGEEAANQLPV